MQEQEDIKFIIFSLFDLNFLYYLAGVQAIGAIKFLEGFAMAQMFDY
jgi:hypothetical protein